MGGCQSRTQNSTAWPIISLSRRRIRGWSGMGLRSRRRLRSCRMGDSAGRSRKAVHLPAEEIADGAGNFMQMRLKREVARVVEMHLRAGHIAPEGFCTRRDEGLIVLAPNGKYGRLRGAEIFLDFGIERDIAGIVHQQIELN